MVRMGFIRNLVNSPREINQQVEQDDNTKRMASEPSTPSPPTVSRLFLHPEEEMEEDEEEEFSTTVLGSLQNTEIHRSFKVPEEMKLQVLNYFELDLDKVLEKEMVDEQVEEVNVEDEEDTQKNIITDNNTTAEVYHRIDLNGQQEVVSSPKAEELMPEQPKLVELFLRNDDILPCRRQDIHLNILLVGEKGSGRTSFIQDLLDYSIHVGEMDCLKYSGTHSSISTMPNIETTLLQKNDEKTMQYLSMGMKNSHTLRVLGPARTITYTFHEMEGFEDRLDVQSTIQMCKQVIERRDTHYLIGIFEQHKGGLGPLLKKKNENTLFSTTNTKRDDHQDERIDLCIYFISSNRFKETDVRVMKEIHDAHVPIVPFLSKSDMLTKEETKTMKQTIRHTCQMAGIPFLSLQEKEEEETSIYPFTIVSTPLNAWKTRKMNLLFQEEKNLFLAYKRVYEWGGTCCVFEPHVSDFKCVYELLTFEGVYAMKKYSDERIGRAGNWYDWIVLKSILQHHLKPWAYSLVSLLFLCILFFFFCTDLWLIAQKSMTILVQWYQILLQKLR
jgi:septin family protein